MYVFPSPEYFARYITHKEGMVMLYLVARVHYAPVQEKAA